MTDDCTFCRIASGHAEGSIVFEDALTLAFVDLRQFHPGHVLVTTRAHLADVRELDEATGAALMRTLTRVARAVSDEPGCEGLSVWHSVGEAANQEVPHLHFHVHPRRHGDAMLQVYPSAPALPARTALETIAARLRRQLSSRTD